jgi:hypothetical protein
MERKSLASLSLQSSRDTLIKTRRSSLKKPHAQSQSYKIEVKSSVRPGTYVPANQNESMRLKKEEMPGNKDTKPTSFAYEKKPYK